MERLRGIAIKVGAVMASLWVVRRVAEFGKAIFDLGSSVLAVENQFDAVFGDALGTTLRERIEDLRLMAGLTRRQAEELLAGAGSMAQGFGMAKDASADFATQVLELSADLASFNNIPTADAARLVQSALIGNTEAARSLKVSFTAIDVQNRALAMTGKATAKELTQEEKALAGLSVMAERAGPMIGDLNRTQNDTDNVAKQVSASWQQVKESLAAVLVETNAGELGLTRLRDTLRDLDHWVRTNAESIGAWAGVTLQSVRAVSMSVVGVVRLLFNTGQVVGDALRGVVSGFVGAVFGMVNTVAGQLNALIETANQLPGIDIGFRFGNLPADVFFADAAASMGRLKGNLADIDNTVRSSVGAWADLGSAIQRARNAAGGLGGAGSADAPNVPTPGSGGGGGGTGEGGTSDIATSLVDSMGQGTAAIDELVAANQDAADQVVTSWTEAGDAVGERFDAMEGLASGLFSAIATGGIKSVAMLAKAKIVENLAAAAENFARALGWIGLGNFASAAAAKASAVGHLKAAALWGAAAGVASAGGSNGGGSAGPGGASIGRGATNAASSSQPAGPEVHIYIDPLDPDNPAEQRFVHRASQQAAERYGTQPIIHRRSGS